MRAPLLLACLFGWCSFHAQEYAMPAIPKGPVYGRHCGIVGAEPYECTRLETLVQFQDTLGVLDMLNDTSYVMKAYGAEGVIRLEKRGVAFDQATSTLAAELRKSNALIWTCHGCKFGLMQLGPELQSNLSRQWTR